MDFAKKILNKYGWKEGEGLGKNSDGIAKPLRANLKFDNAGLGLDQAASDFNNHWWERVFNEAASNVKITEGVNGVAMQLENQDDAVEISTKGYSVKKLKASSKRNAMHDTRYDNFLKTATLTSGGREIEKGEKIKESDIAVKTFKTLTDEELFRACGGRTAHKGARHGLKLSGKLKRLEVQEQELLEQMKKSRQLLEARQLAQKTKKNVTSATEFEAEVTNADPPSGTIGIHLRSETTVKPKKPREKNQIKPETSSQSCESHDQLSDMATVNASKKKRKGPYVATAEVSSEPTEVAEAALKKRTDFKLNPEALSNDISTGAVHLLGVSTKKGKKKTKANEEVQDIKVGGVVEKTFQKKKRKRAEVETNRSAEFLTEVNTVLADPKQKKLKRALQEPVNSKDRSKSESSVAPKRKKTKKSKV